MKKVTLLHCYSDNNFGDLGIIKTTLDLIKSVCDEPTVDEKDNIECNGISTYNFSDERFSSEHKFLRRYTKDLNGRVFPCIFGILDRKRPLLPLHLILDIFRFSLFLLFAKRDWAKSVFLRSEEKPTLELIKASDVLISKGGSFFCDNYGKFGFFSFCRLWYIVLLALRYKKRVVILNQSLGPLNSTISRAYGNYILKRLSNVVLRERVCLQVYPYLAKREFEFSNDIVFFQDIVPPTLEGINYLSVGMTIKFNEPNSNEYKILMASTIEMLVTEFGYNVSLLPQVPVDSDIEASKEVFNMLSAETKKKVNVIEKVTGLEELFRHYSKFNFVIGTRLHSCIFSWSVNVPAINISYHGTKSQGIYNNLGLANWVIDYSDSNALEKIRVLVSEVRTERQNIVAAAQEKIVQEKLKMEDILKKIIFQ